MRKLWLIFAQTATVCLAILFIVATLKPDWLARRQGGAAMSSPVPALLEAPGGPDSRTAAVSSYADAVRKSMPSVVNIYTTKEIRVPNHPWADDPLWGRLFGDRFGTRREQALSLGSGVIASREGHILTNNHVVESADEIEVALADGRKGTAKVIGTDPDTDLAVIKIDLQRLPAITFGRSENVKVGDVALAIGNPFGVGQTVTMGIVSALGRSHLGINTFENFIQTDAAINPGNSGGALIDAQGNLIGINTAIYSRTGGSLGIGFAIPVSTARQIMESLIASGTVTRGYIGVEPQDVTPELAEAFKLPRKDGVIIAGLVSGGPAAKAGMKTGDIMVDINGNTVPDTAVMMDTIAKLAPGTSAKVKVLRDSREIDLQVTVAKRPQPQPQPER